MTVPVLSPAPQRPADRTLALELGADDKAENPYRLVPFDVPSGVTRLEVRFFYPKAENCVIDLGLGDPALGPYPSKCGLRGWSGGARERIVVGRDAATPGYEAGDIMPGRWQVILGLYRLPEHPVEVRLDIRFSFEPRTIVAASAIPDPVRRTAGWYKGDLQSHCFHSDAYGAPEHLHATALREGLDFLAVTDHNTTAQQRAYFDRASSEDLIFIPAYEFTTEWGHANVFGARRVHDFRATSDQDVIDMVRRIRDSGALFSINHDKPTIPWRWAVPDADCMEVWQSHWLAGNHISLARYQSRLSEGRRMTAVGGSDFHQPATEPPGNPFTLARPCTYLWLEELSLSAILDALRHGRSFVTEAPDGPMLAISADGCGMGGHLPAGPTTLEVDVSGGAGDMVQIWDASGPIASRPVASERETLVFVLPNPQKFVRAELVARATHDAIRDNLFAFLGAERPGHSQWDDGVGQPIRRALTSPIYIA
ncbi:CehA/McbA family metallohydrolase [Consotaella aegiceratis]|uniref:CehA/McbA family metallohydrolase n=1 Tax=Consotaella aegiceratis TaxID=3097961 RepID=UPI002F3EBB6A